MDKKLMHLPEEKRRELSEIVSIIKKSVNAEKIILFGSYARGDWVEDKYKEGHITYEYKSDMDILVVVKKNGTANMKLWEKLEQTIHQSKNIKTDVSIIAHGITEVNKKLSEGQYFFSDIVKEGIILYDSGLYQFSERKKLTPAERKTIAIRDFKNWYDSALGYYDQHKYAMTKKQYRIAVFELHQVVERAYAAILLTFTQYKPRIHDIEKLGKLVVDQDHQFLTIFPMQNEFQKRCFLRLKRAYTEARYDMNYKIQKEELEYLSDRVEKLLRVAKNVCDKKISSFESAQVSLSSREKIPVRHRFHGHLVNHQDH